VCFWTWRERRPIVTRQCVVLVLVRSESAPSDYAAMVLGYLRTATPAERVRLVVALSEAGSSLRCLAVSLDVRRIVMARGAAYSLWIRNCAQTMSATGSYFNRIRKAYLVTLWWVSDGGVRAWCARSNFETR
jgi:hypothetical protein